MPLARTRARRSSIDIWPGFVDALAQLLMVIIFMLLVFTAGQFFLSDALSGRDKALKELQHQISELSNLLSIAQNSNATLKTSLASLSAQLSSAVAERDSLKSQMAALAAQAKDAQAKLDAANAELAPLRERADQAEKALASEKDITKASRAQVEQLTAAVAALRQQLQQIAQALDISNAKVKSQQTQIADLGRKLNLALASKVQELARYRSEFFGKLREILGNRPNIRIVGDRFVFQSEVLFKPGDATLGDAAKQQLDPIVGALKQIAAKIPPNLNWVLLIEGHTDHTPINTDQFPSNWELSTERAISVVRYMIAQGIPAKRLAAAGFADTQPIDIGNTPDAYRRNRRIELKLTSS